MAPSYGFLTRAAALLLGLFLVGAGLLGAGLVLFAPRLWWTLLPLPFAIGLGTIFVDVARRGEDPPWLYDALDWSERRKDDVPDR